MRELWHINDVNLLEYPLRQQLGHPNMTEEMWKVVRFAGPMLRQETGRRVWQQVWEQTALASMEES